MLRWPWLSQLSVLDLPSVVPALPRPTHPASCSCNTRHAAARNRQMLIMATQLAASHKDKTCWISTACKRDPLPMLTA